MNLLDGVASVVRSLAPRAGPISDLDISLADLVEMAQAGLPWGMQQTLTGNKEEIERTFPGLVAGAYRSNGAIFACVMTRYLLFSEARFQFQQMRGGQPGDLFGTTDLAILEHPWPSATTGDLLASQILDVDFAGNGFAVRRPGRIERLRPDWVQLVIGSQRPVGDFNPWDPDARLIGITYQPGGWEMGEEPMTFTVDEISHFAPYRDPVARFRGMSWIGPIIKDIMGDSAAMAHKLAYFENGATPSLILQSGMSDPKKFQEHIERFRKAHEGASKAYKTLHLMAGADATVVGSNLRQQSFKETMGHGETRIAAAAGVHPAIVGLSEGLQGSNLNDTVLRAAVKLTGNKTLRPLWRNLAGSLERPVPPLRGTRLWYDDRHIPFLAEDVKDAAAVLAQNATSIRALGDGGWLPDTVRDAIVSGDLRRLVHSGFLPVQVQPTQGDQGPGSAGATVIGYVAIPEFASRKLETRLPKPVGDRVAIRDFTPSSGLLAEHGPVSRGTVLPADALHVAAFPSLFEPVQERSGSVSVSVDSPQGRLTAGPTPIVTTQQVLEKKAELEAEGRPAGYDTLAAELAVSRETIRRRLAEVTTEQEHQAQVQRDQHGILVALAGRSTTVETPVTISPGAVQVEVNAPPTSIQPGAVQVDVHGAPVTIAEGAIQAPIDARTTIERGAIDVDVAGPAITVEPSPVTIEKGAMQVDVHTPPMSIEPGAVQVEVNAAPMSIAEGAVQVEVNTPPMSIAEGAVQVAAPNVTVEPSPVQIAEGAVRVEVHTPAVNVAPPNVTVEAPHVDVQPANVTIAEGAVQVAPTQVDVHVPPAPRRKVVRETEFKTDAKGAITGKREVEEDA